MRKVDLIINIDPGSKALSQIRTLEIALERVLERYSEINTQMLTLSGGMKSNMKQWADTTKSVGNFAVILAKLVESGKLANIVLQNFSKNLNEIKKQVDKLT